MHLGHAQILDTFLKAGNIRLLNKGDVPVEGKEGGHRCRRGDASDVDGQHSVCVTVNAMTKPVKGLASKKERVVWRRDPQPERAKLVQRGRTGRQGIVYDQLAVPEHGGVSDWRGKT